MCSLLTNMERTWGPRAFQLLKIKIKKRKILNLIKQKNRSPVILSRPGSTCFPPHFPFYRSLDSIFNMNYYGYETSLPLVILFSKGLNSLPNIPQLMNKLSSTMRKKIPWNMVSHTPYLRLLFHSGHHNLMLNLTFLLSCNVKIDELFWKREETEKWGKDTRKRKQKNMTKPVK